MTAEIAVAARSLLGIFSTGATYTVVSVKVSVADQVEPVGAPLIALLLIFTAT